MASSDPGDGQLGHQRHKRSEQSIITSKPNKKHRRHREFGVLDPFLMHVCVLWQSLHSGTGGRDAKACILPRRSHVGRHPFNFGDDRPAAIINELCSSVTQTSKTFVLCAATTTRAANHVQQNLSFDTPQGHQGMGAFCQTQVNNNNQS